RGRPEAAYDVCEAFIETCAADTLLLVSIDADDPTCDDYLGRVHNDIGAVLKSEDPRNMGESLASAVDFCLDPVRPREPSLRDRFADSFAIGFMGDDHRPRTHGWDKAYLDALREMGTGIVYGNDLLQGERLPTQVAMTSDIVRALGYMAPPKLVHLYFDNFWLDLGKAADCIRYLPDVVVEHMHPIAGKAKWDDGYKRVNASSMYEHDAAAYAEYKRDHFADDVARVVALRGVAAV